MKIIAAFFWGIAVIYITALIIGDVNKDSWFKKRAKPSVFNRRGMLGERCHFGYPCTWQGVLTALLMYSIIGICGYGIIFKL